MNRMENKIAIVTGGARGIGHSIAKTFVKEGAKMVISVDMSQGYYTFPNVLHVQLNVSDRQAVAEFAEKVKAEFGKVDV